MATVTFMRKDLEQASGTAKFEDAIALIGMEIENEDDKEVTIDITPNRPDLLDITGLGRQIALFNGTLKPNKYEVSSKSAMSIRATKKAETVRPHIAGIVIKNLTLNETQLKYLINFSEKLSETYGRRRKKLALGIHDLSNIKGNLTYDAAEDGRMTPLNEAVESQFSRIISEHKKGIEYSGTLTSGGNKLLTFLKDDEKVISLIPIINSAQTKMTERTKSIFIDITGTEAEIVSKVADILACKFIDIGASVESVEVKYDSGRAITYPRLLSSPMKISLKGFESILGTKSAIGIKQLCERSGYLINSGSGSNLTVEIPPYRPDIINSSDVYEDLIFAYGYDNVEAVKLPSASVGAPDKSAEFANKLSSLMIGLGYTEAYNNYLTNEKQEFEMMGHDYEPMNTVKIKYSKTENISILRDAVLPSLMQNLSDSSSEPMPYRLYEIGKVFRIDSGKVSESTNISFVSEHAKANFSEAMAIAENILSFTGIAYSIEECEDGSFINGRCVKIVANGKNIGMLGEIHPKILENFRLDEPVVAGEISIIIKE